MSPRPSGEDFGRGVRPWLVFDTVFAIPILYSTRLAERPFSKTKANLLFVLPRGIVAAWEALVEGHSRLLMCWYGWVWLRNKNYFFLANLRFF